jgi:hypothetical protein
MEMPSVPVYNVNPGRVSVGSWRRCRPVPVSGDQAVSSREFAVNYGQRTERSNLRLQTKPIDCHGNAVSDTKELQAGGRQVHVPAERRRADRPRVGS